MSSLPCIVPQRPHTWKVQAHGCYTFDNARPRFSGERPDCALSCLSSPSRLQPFGPQQCYAQCSSPATSHGTCSWQERPLASSQAACTAIRPRTPRPRSPSPVPHWTTHHLNHSIQPVTSKRENSMPHLPHNAPLAPCLSARRKLLPVLHCCVGCSTCLFGITCSSSLGTLL